MNEQGVRWHRMTQDAVLTQLHTDAACGLSRKAARSRLKKQGENTLFAGEGAFRSPLLRALCMDPAFLLMLGVMVLAFFFAPQHYAIAVPVLFLVATGVAVPLLRQCYRYERRAASYRVPTVRVLRDGRMLVVYANLVVRGDILFLTEGDVLPCDCRLLSAEGLSVLTLMPNDAGEAKYLHLPKHADALYHRESPETAPYFENMLYGGSEILAGNAVAVVVETGDHCFLGAMKSFVIPAEHHSQHNAVGTVEILKPYLRLWGIGMIGALFLLTVAGLLSAPDGVGVMEVFYPISLLCGTASPALLSLYFAWIGQHGRHACMYALPRENAAVIKSERGAELLAGVTDLFVVGTRGCTDGVAHAYRAALATGVICVEDGGEHPQIAPLCEAFFLLHEANGRMPVVGGRPEPPVDDLLPLRELAALCGYDEEAMRVRLQSVTFTDSPLRASHALAVKMGEQEYRLIFSQEKHAIDRCFLYEDDGRVCALTPEQRNMLASFFEESRAGAARAVAVIRQTADGTLLLVGVLALREQMQTVLPSVVEELSQSGVRTTFFLDSVRVADACRLSGARLLCTQEKNTIDDTDLENYRVFIGFSETEIAHAIRREKQLGRRVALLGGGAKERILLRYAPLMIVTDDTRYHKSGNSVRVYTEPLSLHEERSVQSTTLMRRHADIVVPTAKRLCGGVSAVLQAIAGSRGARLRGKLFLSFLCLSQAARLLLFLLTSFLGVGAMTPVQAIVMSGVLELGALLWLLKLPLPQSLLRKPHRFDGDVAESILWRPDRLLAVAVSVVVGSLYTAILTWSGVIGGAEARAFLFVSFLQLQLLFLYSVIGKAGLLSRRIESFLPLLVTLPPVAILSVLSVWIPALNSVTGTGAWGGVTLLSLPLFPLLYLLTCFFYGIFHRTAK